MRIIPGMHFSRGLKTFRLRSLYAAVAPFGIRFVQNLSHNQFEKLIMKNRYAEKRGFRLAPAALPPRRLTSGGVRGHVCKNILIRKQLFWKTDKSYHSFVKRERIILVLSRTGTYIRGHENIAP